MVTRSVGTIEIQPASLTWARERSGYDLSTASEKLDIKIKVLASMESGDTPLSPAQIRKVATLYRISPAALFLSEPPTEQFLAPKDFRSLSDGSAGSFSPVLRKEIDRARSQLAYMSELREMGIVEPRSLTLTIDRNSPVDLTANLIRGWCEGLTPISSAIRRDTRLHLNWWISTIEDKGILVTQVSKVPLPEMRGFCLTDPFFPMIVLNGSDSTTGRIFTLVHELVHVLLGIEGIINGFQSKDATEVFCNAVAAATLIPKERLLSVASVAKAGSQTWWPLDDLSTLAADFGVSREAMLRRLYTLGKTSRTCFEAQQASLRAEYGRTKAQTNTKGGPAYDIMLLRNLGRSYVTSVLKARERGLISETTTSDFLFSKVRWTEALERRIVNETLS